MSILSVATAPQRRRARRADVPAQSVVDVATGATLADMATGQSARVLGIEAPHDPAGARRMFDLGFVPGAEVRMVRRAPLADPVVFRVAGYDIALRREQARWVSVAAPAS